MKDLIEDLFENEVHIESNFLIVKESGSSVNQTQTNGIFSEKWLKYDDEVDNPQYHKFQEDWYLKLYGFDTKEHLASFLQTKKVILDAGCGLGHKTAWFAKMAPNSIVIGMDFSEAAFRAANRFKNIPNLFFIKGDISQTELKNNSIDYISCDQVIHHTDDPIKTFEHLSNISKSEFSCYVYAKKALPRELVDEYFREYSKKLTKDELWEMSDGLTKLGKALTELNTKFVAPDIPILGIKGGEYDIQRFIYWNFLKCFYNPDLEYGDSLCINFDWYAPSNAFRYSEKEFRKMISDNNLDIIYFHQEEACYSGRFIKRS